MARITSPMTQGGRCPPPSRRAWWDRRRGISFLPALGRPEWLAAASARVPSRRARASLWDASEVLVVDLSGPALGWAVLFGFALSARFVSAPVRLTCRYRCTGMSACATRTEYLRRRFLGWRCLLVRVRRGCCRRRSRRRRDGRLRPWRLLRRWLRRRRRVRLACGNYWPRFQSWCASGLLCLATRGPGCVLR